MDTIFTDSEAAYLAEQQLARLATVAPDGVVQNNPVAFHLDPQSGTIDVGGYTMGRSKKFRNVERRSAKVALVVDEMWIDGGNRRVRGIEIRGWAEALRDVEPFSEVMSREMLRIHPEVVFSWGLVPGEPVMERRAVGEGSS